MYDMVMVKEIEQDSKIYYACEECGLKYTEKEIAEKCQAWCSEHKSCNLEIIQHNEKPSCCEVSNTIVL